MTAEEFAEYAKENLHIDVTNYSTDSEVCVYCKIRLKDEILFDDIITKKL